MTVWDESQRCLLVGNAVSVIFVLEAPELKKEAACRSLLMQGPGRERGGRESKIGAEIPQDYREWSVGTVASWLFLSLSDRAVLVRALVGDIVLCSLTVPLSIRVYAWLPANLLGVTLLWTRLASHPSCITPSRLINATETEISQPAEPLGLYWESLSLLLGIESTRTRIRGLRNRQCKVLFHWVEVCFQAARNAALLWLSLVRMAPAS